MNDLSLHLGVEPIREREDLARLRKKTVKAIADFEMIAEGDRILVGMSGGKDSTALLFLLDEIRKRSKLSFSVAGVMLDQKQPGFFADDYQAWLASHGLPITIISEDTYSIVKEKVEPGKSFCGLCSRLRRGILATYAKAHGFTKIALGHHRDDLNETILLNMFYTGRMASMAPKLFSEDGTIVIRPMAYCAEAEIEAMVQTWQAPLIPCKLCGSQDVLRRKKIKDMLAALSAQDPHIGDSILASMSNIKPSHLLDRQLFPFS